MKPTLILADRLARAQAAQKSGALTAYASKLGTTDRPVSPASWGPMMRV
jgi:hypothetical protein